MARTQHTEQAIEQQLRSLSRDDLIDLAADIWRVCGWTAHPAGADAGSSVDVIAEQDDLYRTTAYIHVSDESLTGREIQRYDRLHERQTDPPVDIVVVITTGEVTETAQRFANQLNVKTVSSRALASFLREIGRADLLSHYTGDDAPQQAQADAQSTRSTSERVSANVTELRGRARATANVRGRLRELSAAAEGEDWRTFLVDVLGIYPSGLRLIFWGAMVSWGAWVLLILTMFVPPLLPAAAVAFVLGWALVPIGAIRDLRRPGRHVPRLTAVALVVIMFVPVISPITGSIYWVFLHDPDVR